MFPPRVRPIRQRSVPVRSVIRSFGLQRIATASVPAILTFPGSCEALVITSFQFRVGLTVTGSQKSLPTVHERGRSLLV